MNPASLTPETRLWLAPGLRTRVEGGGHVLVDAPAGTVIDVGPKGFAVLSLFSRPIALGDAIEQLEAHERGDTDFLPTMSVINTLIEEGVLVHSEAGRGPTTGWADPVEHGVEHEAHRREDHEAEHRPRHRDPEEEDHRHDQEVVEVEERGEAQARAHRHAGCDLARGALGVQRLHQALDELDDRIHAGSASGRVRRRS